MDLDLKLSKRRENRTRAPTACQTCRLRKTRCDNARPICSYCASQAVECIYPETSPHPTQTSFESSNHEILQRLGHITSLLEDIKQDGSSNASPNRSVRGSFFEFNTQNSSPLADPSPSHSQNNRGSTTGIEDRVGDHDPLTLYAANSAEYVLRWPIYNKVVTDAEKNYNQLVHPRNPILDADKLERYARDVTIQGLGWDAPSCQVLLACALACCTSIFIPLSEIPADLDRMPGPPPTDASIELAEAYFHAAKQRLGSLQASPTDIQCFLLAGSYHRYLMRPLQGWFCFQQASCRLEVRLRSMCREQWIADVDYNNLESRLYWSCIQAERESQSELPLWGSGLENLGYTTQLPLIPRSTDTSPADIMDEDNSNGSRSQAGSTSTAEQKGWRFYISTIVSRRTSNDMLIDLWRSGEQHWLSNVKNVVDKTTEAVNVTNSWYQISRDSLPPPTPENQDLEFLVYGRHLVCLEKMYRPIIYVAVHYHTLPYHVQNNHPVSQQVFDHAQKALDTYAILIPNLWHHFRHQWI